MEVESIAESSSENVLSQQAIPRVTVYRLKNRLDDVSGVQVDGFNEVFISDEFLMNSEPASEPNGLESEPPTYSYSIHFKEPEASPPKWYNLFSHLDLMDTNCKPSISYSGYILFINTPCASYACTGGSGHFKMQKELEAEHRFGIEIAKRLLKKGELKAMSQRDTSSFIHTLDRVFRSRYQPNSDTDNLHRILTSIRGTLAKSRESERKEIGTTIKATDSLSVSGNKTLDEVISFVLKVDTIYSQESFDVDDTLKVPELKYIDPKLNKKLVESLSTQLCKDMIKYGDSTECDLKIFIDNEDVGFLPDVTEKFVLKYKRSEIDCGDEYENVIKNLGAILKNEAKPINALNSATIVLQCVGNETPYSKSALSLLCGDVELNGESYFINNSRWYMANASFKEALDREIDEVLYYEPEVLDLLDWTEGEKEGQYNRKHQSSSIVVLDQKFVRIEAEKKNPIEFCDLLVHRENKINLIHVKHDSGAALRALFAQAYVSAKLFYEEKEFKDKLVSGQIDKGSELIQSELQTLSDLGDRKKNELRVVMAIYDDKHSMPITTSNTPLSKLGSSLTLFAKVDLLQRCQSLRSMGYDVALTRIRSNN